MIKAPYNFVNGFGTWGENVKKHGIWGHNSHMNWCLPFCYHINPLTGLTNKFIRSR